jgi:hypothetical protein
VVAAAASCPQPNTALTSQRTVDHCGPGDLSTCSPVVGRSASPAAFDRRGEKGPTLTWRKADRRVLPVRDIHDIRTESFRPTGRHHVARSLTIAPDAREADLARVDAVTLENDHSQIGHTSCIMATARFVATIWVGAMGRGDASGRAGNDTDTSGRTIV